jgi:methyl-accepting chemotaxis protein
MDGVLARIRGSYTTRLAVALVAVVALLVTVGIVVEAEATQRVQEDARTDLEADAGLQAGELDAWLSGVRRDVRRTAAHPAMTAGDAERTREYLDRLGTEDTPAAVAAVHYVDTDRTRITASTMERFEGVNPREQGAPFATDPPAFDGPDDVYVTAPFQVPIAEFPIVAVVSPVPGQDAMVVYMVNVRRRATTLAGTGGESTTMVVDDEGNVLAHPDTSRIGEMIAADHLPLERALAGERGTIERDEGVAGYAPVAGQDWVVMVHESRAEAFGIAQFVRSSLVGLVLFGVVSLALVGATVGSSTSGALRRLATRAERMADGDLDVDLSTRRTDEFGTLYGAFAEMRDSLTERLAEVERARERAEERRTEAEDARERAEAMARDYRRTAEAYAGTMQACADGGSTWTTSGTRCGRSARRSTGCSTNWRRPSHGPGASRPKSTGSATRFARAPSPSTAPATRWRHRLAGSPRAPSARPRPSGGWSANSRTSRRPPRRSPRRSRRSRTGPTRRAPRAPSHARLPTRRSTPSGRSPTGPTRRPGRSRT